MKLSKLKLNRKNPRRISEQGFRKLLKSVGEFGDMLPVRPIVVDEDNVVLGGNMRLLALRESGVDEIPDEWVRRVEGWTEEMKREFVIKDNASYGDWDWDVLANEWSDLPLEEWTLEIPKIDLTLPEDGPALDGKGAGDREPTICPNCGHEFD